MISDIISALEFLLSIIKHKKDADNLSSDQKKSDLAKQLHEIYETLNKVIDSGRIIFSSLNNDTNIPVVISLKKIIDQQRNIEKLTKLINDNPVASILKLHIPQFKELEFISNSKYERLGFFALTLISNNKELLEKEIKEVRAKIPVYKEPSMENILINRRDNLTEEELVIIEKEVKKFEEIFSGGSVMGYDPENLSKRENITLLENSCDMSLLQLSETLDCNLNEIGDASNVPVRMFSTANMLHSAKTAINDLECLSNDLRSLLIKRFSIDDFY